MFYFARHLFNTVIKRFYSSYRHVIDRVFLPVIISLLQTPIINFSLRWREKEKTVIVYDDEIITRNGIGNDDHYLKTCKPDCHLEN